MNWIIATAIVIVCFLLREVYCWYWKINRSIELQEETNRLLKKLVDQNTPKQEANIPQQVVLNETDLNEPGAMDDLLNNLKHTV